MYTARLLLVLMLTLGISAEAQTSRRSRSKSKTRKPAVTKPVPKPVPVAEEPEPEASATEPEPGTEPASEAAAAKPEAPEPTAAKSEAPEPTAAPLAQPGGDAAVVFAIPRTGNAEPAAIRLQAELNRLLASKADVQLVNLGEAFPAPPPPSLQEADALYEQGKEAYDNLDPEAAAGKFTSAAEAYEKHPATLNPQRLAKTFIFMGASQLLNGDKVGAKASFLRALAAEPGTQPDQVLFGSDVQTVFTDAQQEFNAQKPGTLDIDSKPSGARVTLRGDDLGVTPLKNVPVHPGRHPVVITLPGYVPYASYPQVAPEKNAELKPQLEPLPALAEVIAVATRASSERSFDSDKMPPDVATLASKLSVRYVILAAVQQKKSDPAEAELQVWDVRTKNRLRGVEVELEKGSKNTPVAAADRVHGFLTGRALTDSSTPSNMPPMLKKPWFWAAVVGGAAVVTGGILYATQDRSPGSPTGPISGLPGLGF